MRKIVPLFGVLTLFSVMGFAEDWSGRLLDAPCYQKLKSSTACDPTTATKSFILIVNNTPYTLDATGNQKAETALKMRADRSTTPNKPATGEVMAKVTGTKEANDHLKVESVDIQ